MTAIRRKDNPRIEAIETEIGRLTSELLVLADISRDDLTEGARDAYEAIREVGWEAISDYDAAIEVLDQRDIDAEVEGAT